MVNHDCDDFTQQHLATKQKPYRFVDSGLSNVYLIGVRYSVCQKCGKQSAEIPAVINLMKTIAREIVQKDSSLTGPEIRFLRKRLGKKATDFAAAVGVSAEQVSRWEHNGNPPEKGNDLSIRMYYDIVSGEKAIYKRPDAELEAWYSGPRKVDVSENIQVAIKNDQWQTAAAQDQSCNAAAIH
jgi:putative zinc finger/helix-turn-helix YgiT family protein